MSPIKELMQSAGVSERLAIGSAIIFAIDRPTEFKAQFGEYFYTILCDWAKEFDTKS